MVKDKIKNIVNKYIIKNIPNVLTWSRIGASVGAAALFLMGNVYPAFWLYAYGAVSDFLDGLAARKLNAFSEFGRKLDAFSDKLYAGSLLIPSILCGNLLMLIPLAFELGIAGINLKGQKLGIKTETHRVGKIKTVALFPTMIIGLLATVNPSMYMLLWPMMIATTNLQYNSIVVYNNVLNQKLLEKDKIVEEAVEISDNNSCIDDASMKTTVSKNKEENKFKYIRNSVKKTLNEAAYYTMYQVPSTSKNGFGRVLKR